MRKPEEVMERLLSLARVGLATLPTPLHEACVLGGFLGGPKLFFKRDDLTGLALGGNKLRKLEFVLADAMAKGADTVITTGGPQSNHACETAAAARRLGMEAVLVLDRPSEIVQGNLLLDRILGAEVRFVNGEEEAQSTMLAVAERLTRLGRHPYVIPLGASTGLGALGYVLCVQEMKRQFSELGIRPSAIVVATGSGGTQAGLMVGCRLFALGSFVVGVNVGKYSSDVLRERILNIAEETGRILGWDPGLGAEDVVIEERYAEGGYGVLSQETREAIKLVAQKEGVFLDPVYTGKAMACLVDLVRMGTFSAGDVVVFLHTGGQGALFAYADSF